MSASDRSAWLDKVAEVYSAKRESKYKAKPQVIDGIRFASQKEAKRYAELKLLEKAGEIRGLILQPSFSLAVWRPDHGEAPVIGTYRADFQYEKQYRVWRDDGTVTTNWRTVVEDVKGFKTPLYKWKKRHVEAQCDVTIVEI